MSKDLTLQVVGSTKLNCAGCEHSAELILSEIDGVQQARANHQTQRIEVVFEPEMATIGQIQAALEDIGYTTTAVSRPG